MICACLVMALSSCSKIIDKISLPGSHLEESDGFKRYVIKKNEHYSQSNGLKNVSFPALHFKARFDSSSIYKTKNPENQYDINKLYGVSDCGDNHQVNSARYGWRWNGEAIEIFAYCYVNSIRETQLLGTVSIGEELSLGITTDKHQYDFLFREKHFRLKRSCSGEGLSGYQLYPYFGGDETAPHEVRVFIKEVQL